MIGCDFYFSFVTGRCVRGDAWLVAMETTIGWTVSGPLKKEHSVASNNFVKTHVMNVSNSEKAVVC